MSDDMTLLESLGGTEPSSSAAPVKPLPTSILPQQKTRVQSKVRLSDLSDTALESDIAEYALTTDDIITAAKASLDFLAALVMPLIFTYAFPPVFKAVWEWLLGYAHQVRIFPQLALGLPRGFGKTTLVKLFVVYCILFTKKRFILVISAKASLAENIISDVIDMLEESNIKRVFGDWKLGIEKDTQALKKFGYRGRNITLAAIGAGSSLRGLNIKNDRPDVMIFEDIQSRECADSEVQSTALENWMVGTAMKAKSPQGCMFLFIANMYPTKWSILRKLKDNHMWTKFIAGGILADGTSLWEELQPISQLLSEFETDLAMGKPEIFYSEVLNDEHASANNLIDLSKLPELRYQEGDIPAGNFIIIDPATDKLGSDEVSIGYFEIHDAMPVLMELKEGRLSPGETIRHALDFALLHNCRLIAVESNAYQYSLLYWFEHTCTQIGISGIQAVDIYSGQRSKNARILDMFKAYAAGEIFVHQKARAAVHLQITSFNPLRKDNTDGLLDLLTYAPRVVSEYGEFVIASNIIDAQEYESATVADFNSPF